jgi:hypothetical protein
MSPVTSRSRKSERIGGTRGRKNGLPETTLRLQADAIIDRVPQSLLAPKVPFGRCHRNMAEQVMDVVTG